MNDNDVMQVKELLTLFYRMSTASKEEFIKELSANYPKMAEAFTEIMHRQDGV